MRIRGVIPSNDSDSAENLRSSFESLRTNGGAVEINVDFPFMMSVVEVFLEFFQQYRYLSIASPTAYRRHNSTNWRAIATR
jgi:hypothetical protein